MTAFDLHRHQRECRVHEPNAVAAVKVLAHRHAEEALVCFALVCALHREVTGLHEPVGVPATVKLTDFLGLEKLLGPEEVSRMVEHFAKLPRRALQEGAQRVHKSIGHDQLESSAVLSDHPPEPAFIGLSTNYGAVRPSRFR